MEMQTTGHVKTPDQNSVRGIGDLKMFMGGLKDLATTLYKGTVTSHIAASAHRWSLKLSSPERSNDIEKWKFADISTELSFFGP
jgi:hypothetical protein